VDDGSTDDTPQVVSAFFARHPECSITSLSKANGGQSSARNFGAQHATGEWLAFLDQDDVWMPDRLRVVLPYLNDAVDLVYTDANTIDAAGVIGRVAIHANHGTGTRHPKLRLTDVLFADAFVMPGVMTVRSSFFRALGGFDERLSGYEDDDLFVRVVERGRIAYVAVPTLLWRMYDANYSRSHRMVASRALYWQNLMRNHAGDVGLGRRITRRFVSEFLTQCSAQFDAGDHLALDNLAAAYVLLAHLSWVDRAAFMFSRWAWMRHGSCARASRWWFLNGLREDA
jgi:glycosyltransferase involved in cell wall biosynthesis